MRVTVYVNEEFEVEVPVTDVIEQLPGSSSAETDAALKSLISRCVNCLKAIPDDRVAELEPKARNLVANALIEQATRYGHTGTAREPLEALLKLCGEAASVIRQYAPGFDILIEELDKAASTLK